MEQLTRHDIRKVLSFIHTLYAIRTHEEFCRDVVALLPRVISTDVSSYNEVNSSKHIAVYRAWPLGYPDIPDSQEIFGRYAYQSPLITYVERTQPVEAHKTTDFISQRQFRTTDLYNEFYRPLRLPYTMGTSITVSHTFTVALALNRVKRDFSDHDLAILDVLRPHLIQAYHNAIGVSRMQDHVSAGQDALATQHQGLVSLTLEGRIRFATPTAERLLARYNGRTSRDHGCLSAPIRAWARNEIRRQASDSAWHHPTDPLQFEGPDGNLTIRLLHQNEQFVLLVEERPTECTTGMLRKLGLSARETEILGWVLQGKTNPEIGQILGISRRTVQKHLERVYSRLGVENRHAAMTMAIEAIRRARFGNDYD